MKIIGLSRRAVLTMSLTCVAGASQAGGMIVGDYLGNKVALIDDERGTYIRTLASGGPLDRPLGVAFGPNGYLYVASYRSNQILRYNENGQFVDVFLSTPKPHGIAFINDDLVVSNHSNGTLTRVGAISWVSQPKARFYHSVVVRDGRVFASFNSNSGGGVEEFDGNSGASRGDLIPVSRGLQDVQGFAWGYDGILYATSSNNTRLFRFNGDTGAPLGSMRVTGGAPLGVRFNSGGAIVSTSFGSTAIVQHSPMNQSYMGQLLAQNSIFSQPWYLERMNPTLECRLQFEGWQGANNPNPSVLVEFRRANSPLSISTQLVTMKANGRFDINSPAYLAEYDIWVKSGNFLSKVVRVDTRDSSRSFPVFVLRNGDGDGSNVVDSADFKLVNQAFGKSSGEPGYDPAADLNGDGEVGPADITWVSTNFGKQGDM